MADCNNIPSKPNYYELIGEYGSNPEEIITRWNASCTTRVSYRTAIAYIEMKEGESFQARDYPYNSIPRCFGLMDTSTLEDIGVAQVRRSGLDLTGRGILTAIIDTGIDYTHPAFQYENQTSKVLDIWDQTLETENPFMPYGYGIEYKREDLNEALKSEVPFSVVPTNDTNGHGTFLAGITVGRENEEAGFSGIAPNSSLVIVKLREAKEYLKEYYYIEPNKTAYAETDIMLAVNYVLSKSVKYQMPIVVYLGVGTSQSAHVGSGPLNQYLANVAGIGGVSIVACGGNEGASNHHYEGTVDNDTREVELKVGGDEYGFTLELWGSAPNQFFIEIISPTGQRTGTIQGGFRGQREVTFLLERTKVIVDYFTVDSAIGAPIIMIRFQSPAEGIWKFNVSDEGVGSRIFNMWLPITNFLSEDTFFLEATPFNTLTSPANTMEIMGVGTYNQNNQSVNLESGRGYPTYGMVKPDFVAPGVEVLGPLPRGRYGRKTGSSVAGAMVAGISALLLEWGILQGNDTEMNTIRIKGYLIRGAKRDPNRTYPNREWGYGVVDLYEAFLKIR
ncbi:MAG: S8 family peptidase [Anaerostipes sp.]|nr:S8 family peptidase [Anaerostipes sp.]